MHRGVTLLKSNLRLEITIYGAGLWYFEVIEALRKLCLEYFVIQSYSLLQKSLLICIPALTLMSPSDCICPTQVLVIIKFFFSFLVFSRLYVQWRFLRGIEPQFLALQKGFHELIPSHLLKPFDERELEVREYSGASTYLGSHL